MSPKTRATPKSFLPFEADCRARGYTHIAGVDEVGRGPLAGPVVAAAVILPSTLDHIPDLAGLNDSKKLSESSRERLCTAILTHSLAFGLGMCSAQEIDTLNILQASLLAMKRALDGLRLTPSYVLIDGNQRIPHPLAYPQETVIGGDSKVRSIAAASIVAKVTRDRLMTFFDRDYPDYGFAQHKGYGTPTHVAALAKHGPTPLHRYSFKPVRQC